MAIQERHTSVLTYDEKPHLDELSAFRRVRLTFPYYPMYEQEWKDGVKVPLMLVNIPEDLEDSNHVFIGSGIFHYSTYSDGSQESVLGGDVEGLGRFNPSEFNYSPFIISEHIAFIFRGKNGYKFTSEDAALLRAMMLDFIENNLGLSDIEIGNYDYCVGNHIVALSVFSGERAIRFFEYLAAQSKMEFENPSQMFLNRFELHPCPAHSIGHLLTDDVYFVTNDDLIRKIKVQDVNFGNIKLDYVLPDILDEYQYIFSPDVHSIVAGWIRSVLLVATARRNGNKTMAFPNLMSLGAAGTGKTFLAEILPKLLEDLGLKVRTFNVGSILNVMPNDEDDIMALMGYNPEVGTYYKKTELAKFLEAPDADDYDISFILMDEVNRVSPVAQNKLFTLTNNPRPTYYNVYGDDFYEITNNTCYIASGNIGGRFQVYPLDEAFMRRFIHIAFGKQTERRAYYYVYDKVSESFTNSYKHMNIDVSVLEGVFSDNRDEIIRVFTEIVNVVSSNKIENAPIPVGLALFKSNVEVLLMTLLTDIINGSTTPTIDPIVLVNMMKHSIANNIGTDVSTVGLQYPELEKIGAGR